MTNQQFKRLQELNKQANSGKEMTEKMVLELSFLEHQAKVYIARKYGFKLSLPTKKDY